MKPSTRRRLKWWRDYLFWLVVLPVWVPFYYSVLLLAAVLRLIDKAWDWIWRETRRFAE